MVGGTLAGELPGILFPVQFAGMAIPGIPSSMHIATTMSTLNNDLPTLNNKIGWAPALNRLVWRIASCPTPHVLAIHGDWGSGKTSFMRQLQWELGGETNDAAAVQPREQDAGNPGQPVKPPKDHQSKVITIWFDAWRYQNEPSPIVALLQEMRQQLTTAKSLVKRFNRIGFVATASIMDTIGQAGKAIGIDVLPDIDKIQKRGEQWEQSQFAQPLTTNEIRGQLQKAILQLLPDKKARVVIFIDDLDRCNPKAAMRLLEGLKIYLSLSQCVFVLGMNEGVLTDAIREEFSALKGNDAELRLRASHYLEKICTDIYRLPLPDGNDKLLLAWLKENSEYREKHSAKKQIAALEQAIKGLECLPPNPRRIKALANQWPRFAATLPFPQEEPTLSAAENLEREALWATKVLVATYIHQFNRELWERWHHNVQFWEEIMEWCKDPTSYKAKAGINPDHWCHCLILPWRAAGPNSASGFADYPNPGDQRLFWIGNLILQHQNAMKSGHFQSFLTHEQ